MKKPDRSARVVSLRRYIDLLNLEEKRLTWILGITNAPNPDHANAAANAKVISEKIRKAEMELSDLMRYR